MAAGDGEVGIVHDEGVVVVRNQGTIAHGDLDVRKKNIKLKISFANQYHTKKETDFGSRSGLEKNLGRGQIFLNSPPPLDLSPFWSPQKSKRMYNFARM